MIHILRCNFLSSSEKKYSNHNTRVYQIAGITLTSRGDLYHGLDERSHASMVTNGRIASARRIN